MTDSASLSGSHAARRATSGRAALAGILLPGAVGFAIVARTLFFYVGSDLTATLLVVAIAAGLALGLVELVARCRRALALEAEIGVLPPQLDEPQLERLDPALRQLLRARLEHAPAGRDPGVTPYLVGLLVMLGLLGTLLGLFETLSGAGHALTASSNVDALRSGLSGPLRGLMRSFGCSAAGVSASAMLGLAAALVRRRETRVHSAVDAYANGPLRALSPLRRQAGALQKLAEQGDALRKLADQGDALPRAASALELAAERLGGLAERWDVAHRAAAAAQHQALEQGLRSLRGELSRAAVEAGRELQASLAKQVERLLQSSGELLSQQVARSMQAVEQDSAVRRESDAALRDRLQAELSTLRAALEQDAAARRESDTALRDRLQAELSTLRAALEQDAAARHESDAVRRDQLQAELGTLTAALDQRAAQQTELARAQLATLDGAAQRLGQLADGVGEQLGARLTLVAELGDRSQQAMALLERNGSALSGALERHDRAIDALVGQAREQLAQLQEAAAQGTQAALERVVTLANEQQETAAQRTLSALERVVTLANEQQETATQRTLSALERATTLANEQQEAAAQRTLSALDRTTTLANEQQETATQRTLSALERATTLANEQAERLAQYERQLQLAQEEHGKGLSAQLTAHAAELGRGLDGTGELVREAAGLLKASSVELGAVAEAFTHSVERQREAASTWLESLGELEGAVERAGRGAAADALGDQLASTQEVFARQLQFQRELFEQLRSLRTAPPAPGPHGERDVSA